MKKKSIIVIFISLFLLTTVPYLYVEVLTSIYYDETKDLYQNSAMLSSDNYHKVVSYSEDKVKILSCEPKNVFLCKFTKTADGEWNCDEFKPVIKRGSLTEVEFYPIYPTKHLILPGESKENFQNYEAMFKDFAKGNDLQYSVTLAENEIDRDISLISDKEKIIVSLYNDYNGLSGCETVEITYYSSDNLEIGLFVKVQELCIHKVINERECVDFLETKKYHNSASEEIKNKFPHNIQVNSKDVLGNGEYVLSYIETSGEKILHLRGLTKRS